MRKILICVISLLLFLPGCSSENKMVDENQASCIKDLKNGLEERLSLKDSTNINEYVSVLDKSVNVELDKLHQYESVTFEDEKFNTLIADYIDAVINQKEAIKYFPSDLDQFDELYNEKGTEIRRES